MRSILRAAAVAVLVLLVIHHLRTREQGVGGPYPPPPADEWFQTHVIAPSQDQPVVVKFGARWCGPCRAMESQLASLEQALPGRVEVVEIDTDERPELAHHFGVRGIPRTFLLSGGRVVDDREGYLSSRELEAWVRPWLH